MIIFISAFISALSFAQSNMDQFVKYITTNPSPEVACEQNVPEHCHHLSRAACQERKTRPERRLDMDYELEDKHVLSLEGTPSALQISRGRQAAIREAETLTQRNAGVTSAELSGLVSDVKQTMIREINAGPITQVVKGRMTEKINRIRFTTGAEYITGMKRWFINNQGISAAAAETEATNFYAAICGNQGMAPNAFYDSNIVAFVLCPGLIQDISEYGMEKPTFMNALSFTIGHELGHAIDTTLYPRTYESMGDCHNTENFNWSAQGTEVVADYWGGKVLAERMRAQEITDEDAVRTINYAQGYLCGGIGDEHHPDGDMRIDRIMGRDPQVRAQLGCSEPTTEQPFCGINGRQSAR